MFCVNCGAKLTEGMKFCESCGTPVAAAIGEQEAGPSKAPVNSAAAQSESQPLPPISPYYQAQQAQQPQPQQQPAQGQQQSPYAQASQQPHGQPAYGQQTPQQQAHYAQGGQPGAGKPKGKVPVVPIAIAVVAVIAIILIVVFVAKPGSQPAASSASSASASASASQQASAPAGSADKFVGDWKLAGVETQGVSICGDVSNVLGFEGALSIAKDGTGSLDVDKEKVTFNWEQAGDDAITLNSLTGDSNNMLQDNFTVSYKDEAISFTMKADGMEGSMIFTKDGTVKWMREISMDNAEGISSSDVLNGTTWNLTGVAMQGVSMYGDAEAIGSFMPSSMASTSVKFKKDGTVNLMGEDATWKITNKGNAVITAGSEKVTVKKLGDDIVIDLSDYVATDLVMLLSKAK